ncbi:capsule assembly Wzi family protein [Candidatus Kryptobacter tengchongensis]|uniref:Capsule assembly protein Wzi n=2 Tax=Kryptobacter tengchongensis TaxID=1643429 RepID=A0A916LJS8_KRYT1|nr:capsule assembly Wzi family protein [Candidatus Kryptobacter tengchongensis]CUS98957.1 Capsule assembly protein Wzi [Candidatus Kryptobacter tengchongensis]
MKRVILIFLIFSSEILSQVENVPISHRVYQFLKRMEVRGIIKNFDDASLPISRGEVANFLNEIYAQRDKLSKNEQGYLELLMIEFENELKKENFFETSIINDGIKFNDGLLSDKAKYLYTYRDSNVNFFADLLFNLDTKFSRSSNVVLAEIGGRLRGTYDGKLGFYLQSTDGQSFGDKGLALEEIRLRQNYKFNEEGSVNFDFTDAYIKYQSKYLSFQLGREFITQGYGFSGKLFISQTSPSFDFFKIRFKYKGISYDFVHSWLLGTKFIIPDTIAGNMTLINSKYLATHRLNFNFWDKFNFGVWEGVIYTKRFPELAYLNPINFYKSAEHSLQDRDNALLGFDFKSNIFKNLQIYGTVLIDDINFPTLGTGWYGNELGYQFGLYFANFIKNADLILEYTRIEPYVYSHRFNENNYTHNGFLLGHEIGPNSDDFFIKIIYLLSKRATLTIFVERTRHGRNPIIESDTINVGGDFNLGHRQWDAEKVKFLDGIIENKLKLGFDLLWEIKKDILLGFGAGKYEKNFLTYVKIKVDY